MAGSLASQYAFRWIAVNGRRISGNRSAFSDIVVGTGDSLGEALEIARRQHADPLSLFYVFVRPPLEFNSRQSGD
jgi:hypothetical protein